MIDTAALRKKILKSAVTGKITKQLDSDTPVSSDLKEYIPTQLDIDLDDIPDTWKYCKFDEVIINRDSERIPVSVADRKKLDKVYDYYGASGVIDKVDRYLFDKDLLLIGEDGANLLSRSTPIAFIARGKYWVNNHAHVLDVTEHILLEYVELIINSMSLVPYVTGAAQPKLSQGMMNKIALPVAPIEEQQRIVDTVKVAFDMLDQIDELQQQYSSDLEVLKSKIIDAGIQGKLTEQLPEDGTAGELLKQIAEEKKLLIKEKKIKTTKTLPEITEDEMPFEIPDNWKWVHLEDTGVLQTGATPPKTDPEYFGNDIPFLSPGEIKDNTIVSYDKQGLSKLGIEKARVVDENSVLQVCIGGSIGKAAINDRKVTFNQQINSLTPILCEAKYLFYCMISSQFIGKIQMASAGAATPIINKSKWGELIIPLPPVNEQIRIVERIETILNAINN
ncbi:Restriction endonuclease S subunit [Lachnospiraceae bacterium RM5]|nr:Restriction endonuclease S subunit [Lachnospiraceae bacterium RM5]